MTQLLNSQNRVEKSWRLPDAAERVEKKEQQREETARIAVENEVKKAAVETEKESALDAEMNGFYSFAVSRCSYDVDSGELLLK